MILELHMPTGFDHMTVHFSGGTNDLPAMLVRHLLVQILKLCLFQLEIEQGTQHLRANRCAFYHSTSKWQLWATLCSL